MSVTSCHAINDSFAFQDGKATYTVTYRIKTDDPTNTGRQACDGAVSASPDPLPVPYQTFSLNGDSDANAVAKSFRTNRQDITNARCYHEVTVEFGPEDSDKQWDNRDDPTTRPVRIEAYGEEVEEIVEEGWNEEELSGLGVDGAPDTLGAIVNAAGKEPGSPITKKRLIPGLRFKINVPDLATGVGLRADYLHKLNDAPFYDASIGCAFVSNIDIGPEQTGGGSSYREVTFDILNDENGFSIPLVNRGYEFLNASGDLQLAREDDTDMRSKLVSEPINLELDGTRTPAGERGTVINWRIYDFADFSGMGIGG
jgi:hypothetical protein